MEQWNQYNGLLCRLSIDVQSDQINSTFSPNLRALSNSVNTEDKCWHRSTGMDTSSFTVGQRVEVINRDVCGTVAFIGTTSFASGKWIGVVLDEPKGKNNGSFQGTFYFEAPENHGLFVRQSQLASLTVEVPTASRKGSTPQSSAGSTKASPPKPSTDESKLTSKQSRSRIPGFGYTELTIQTTTKINHSEGTLISSTVVTPSPPESPFKFAAKSTNSSNLSMVKDIFGSFKQTNLRSSPMQPRPSKSVAGLNRHDSTAPQHVMKPMNSDLAKSSTFLGNYAKKSHVLSRPSIRFETPTLKPPFSIGPVSKLGGARSSPYLNSPTVEAQSTSIPFPSMGDLRNTQKTLPRTLALSEKSSSLQSPISTYCNQAGGSQAFASRQILSSGVKTVLNTPPKKPPRPSILKTPKAIVPDSVQLESRCSQIQKVETTALTIPKLFESLDSMDSGKIASCLGSVHNETIITKEFSSAEIAATKRARRISLLKKTPSFALALQTKAMIEASANSVNTPITPAVMGMGLCTENSNSNGISSTTSPIEQSGSSVKSDNQRTTVSRFSKLVSRNFFRRLPIAGSNTKESPKSLQTSPSGSKTNLSTPAITGSGKPDLNSSKRQSFVETIAETIVPQYIQGPLYTPTMTPSSSGPQGEDRFGALQYIESMRNEVKDLTEKLEVLKAKRAADQEKLREVDRLRLQVETLSEFKTKVLESQATLQRELKKAKQDARDAIVAKEKSVDELATLSESVELVTLDKEMAEEKAETLQMELEHCNEKIAALTTELTAIKDEMSGDIDPELRGANSIQLKQLMAENQRLKEGLLRLRDSVANDKHQHQKLVKEAEVHKTEVTELSHTKERLEARCEELEAQLTDLQEMNDAALGAEEMVVNLTEKNLNLEEKVSQLAEAVADLEALQDVNDQLQESAKEVEMELRDESRRLTVASSNVEREKEALIETLSDREGTIVRFRELVQKLRDENEILRKNLEEESSKTIPTLLPEALDFKKIFAESKAQTTAIDLELRRLEAKEAALHATYLSSFMPDGFMKRGGDNDALLVLLLVPRIICKAELLLSQARDKLVPATLNDGAKSTDELIKSPDVDRYAFSCQFTFLLQALLCELHRWSTALNSCSTDDFLRVGLLYTELSIQEKAVDFYLELLRKSQLDENIPLDGLEKCISSFQGFFSHHLGDEQIVPSTLVSDVCLASAAASDCLIVDAARLINVLQKNENTNNVADLLEDVKTIGESLRQLSKRTRRYLPDPPKQPPVSNKLQSQLLNDSVTLTSVVKVFQEACKHSMHHVSTNLGKESDGIPSDKIEEYFQAAMEKRDCRVEGSGGFKEVVKEWLTTALMTMTDLAQVVNEAPIMLKEKPPTPVSLRAHAVKEELDQSRNLKIQLEDKETVIDELRKVIRSKQEELSQASIRKELAERKLLNANKDNEMTVEKLTRKLEDLQLTLQRKEREFQATLEHFQAEIEAVENEKGELKEKLMSASKRKLLEGIAQSTVSTPLASPSHHGKAAPPSLSPQVPLRLPGDSSSSSSLLEYTRCLQRQNWRLKSQKLLETMSRLKPLDLPKKEEVDYIKQLQKEYWKLKHESNTLLCETLKIWLNKEFTPGRKQYLYLMINSRKSELADRMVELKNRINAVMAERKQYSVITADFATFQTDQSKQEANHDAVKVGMIRFPGWEKGEGKAKRVVLSREQLKRIHDLLAPI